MRRTYSWNEPPTSGRWTREEFDRWCWEMHHKKGHNYSTWLIAQRLGVSENRITNAIERVDENRYDG